ncbi:MAG: serine/threonine protein kinase, partial [Gammaproteobacteria bacterium]|nr:serine/threonine protein kinase [Xanthomonadales bacterium]NIQ27528.1 serine/threonine protein kinase [Gammaproteobacteria bacterium]
MLGFVLRLRGVLSLHASVIDINGEAVGFMGAAGAGKSTLAAAFAKKGFAVMSDDILALKPGDSAPFAQPGYPRLRLWPDSAVVLFGSASALP